MLHSSICLLTVVVLLLFLPFCVRGTGPPDRKMVINALNAGAKVFMADFEGQNCALTCASLPAHLYLRAIRACRLDCSDVGEPDRRADQPH